MVLNLVVFMSVFSYNCLRPLKGAENHRSKLIVQSLGDCVTVADEDDVKSGRPRVFVDVKTTRIERRSFVAWV